MKYLIIFLFGSLSAIAQPYDNPIATRYGDQIASWTADLAWDVLVNIHHYPGGNWDEKFENAQNDLLTKGGGVVFFPAGHYSFSESLAIKSHIIIRGENPKKIKNAYDGEYELSTHFDFPKYDPYIGGKSNNAQLAFKGIRLAVPNTSTHCGVVNVAINHGHIKFGADVYHIHEFAEGFETYGCNHIIFGCILRNAAISDPNIPYSW